MENNIKKYCDIVRNSSNENEKAINKKTIIDYINEYHNANLDTNCILEDILVYSLKIFEKIKANMEYYLKELEKQNNFS